MCRDVFSNGWRDYGSRGDYTSQFWEEIHRSLQYLHGRLKLSPHARADTPADDSIHFLLTCEPQEFLDFIELIFRVQCLFHVMSDEDELVDAINELFKSEDAPYQLTRIVKQEEEASGPPPFHSGRVIRTIAYPKVVWAEEVVTFTEAVLPALSVLAEPAYRSANLEFREALEDCRKGDYGDCLTKCGSAFESVMKVLCANYRWPFTAQDTAAPLLRTILANTGLDNFFEQPLILIATLRDRLSKAHGAGTTARNVERHVAQYAITSTAAAILLLVHEAR
ncbi:MAG: hypothetical protein M3361_10980 [Candidatus Tectomicrobia bacterium]|nr:hypothetical protein [Candidatus Tectomicrobia bacterium]